VWSICRNLSPATTKPQTKTAVGSSQQKSTKIQSPQKAKGAGKDAKVQVHPKELARFGIKEALPRKGKVNRQSVMPRSEIPRSPVIKGLKMPKSNSAGIHDRLKKKSPWYESLRDPLHGADVKIPDSTGVETGTLQCVQRVAITTNAAGTTAVRSACLLPNYNGGEVNNYNVSDPDLSTASDVVWASAQYPFSSTSPLQTYAIGVRVVSAALYLQSESSLSNNSGLMTCFCRPYPEDLTTDGPISDYANLYKSAVVPINANEPAMVRFYPVKVEGGQYDMFTNPLMGTGFIIAGQAGNPRWEMGIIVSGAPAGTQFLATFVVNYEFIPEKNAINILDASPSPVDAQEVDLVELWSQDLDVSTITTNSVLARAPSSSTVEEPGSQTGFGMFFEVIKELAPLALSLL